MYRPGEYTARVKLKVIAEPCKGSFLSYVPVGTVMTVKEIVTSEDGWETFGLRVTTYGVQIHFGLSQKLCKKQARKCGTF